MNLNKLRILLCIVIMTVIASAVSGCTEASLPAETENETKTVTESVRNDDLKDAEEKSLQIAALFKDIYLNAEKTDSEIYPNQSVVSQNDIDKIEDLLKDKGYSVMNTSEKYPAYLENAENFYEFWKSVSSGKDAQQDLIAG